jgi:hypothetical protein
VTARLGASCVVVVQAYVEPPAEDSARMTRPPATVVDMACVVAVVGEEVASCIAGGTEAAIVVPRSEAVDQEEAHSIAVEHHTQRMDGGLATVAWDDDIHDSLVADPDEGGRGVLVRREVDQAVCSDSSCPPDGA